MELYLKLIDVLFPVFLILEFMLLRNLAKANAVTGFINSDGWKLNPANENHDLDPLTSSILSIDEIYSMTDKMIEAHGNYLPKYI